MTPDEKSETTDAEQPSPVDAPSGTQVAHQEEQAAAGSVTAEGDPATHHVAQAPTAVDEGAYKGKVRIEAHQNVTLGGEFVKVGDSGSVPDGPDTRQAIAAGIVTKK